MGYQPFSDASQNFPMHKTSLVSFWIGRLMYYEQIKVIIRQADPYNKTGDVTKGHTGKCIRQFGGIYAYCRYFIDRKW